VYLPGFSLIVKRLLPPMNVDVAPRTLPLFEASVRLCSSSDWFVKTIATVPALARRTLGIYLSLSLGSAASARGRSFGTGFDELPVVGEFPAPPEEDDALLVTPEPHPARTPSVIRSPTAVRDVTARNFLASGTGRRRLPLLGEPTR
jgi:hypothetical protein